nr:NADH dehydrogenase subunit 4 [Stylosanthes capitata]YP_010381021.1 NADH dehydrogenase subunit 4 [Stylosanthes seabrana]UDH54693.1 NADH dehydrogenase subunit 4 [Stylosanthes hamata]UDH54759.1 NADH dehydrogenase subunit 4 [Stylosanthes scabra]UDH54957.1 NADH dehydrogenase subunit 4 [Stylosanthes guianensis]UDH54795.1 NADH dehydrogenase subunit 4 [Stylosanthes capitata]UDH54923.1 NADH dehydrogenase subunit 4 [Stylosanthes seabrana]
MLEHFCECYSDLSGPILCPVLGSIIPIFIPNSRIRPIRLIGLCASLITFLYSPVPRIQFDPSTAKSQFVESLRWLPYENINFYLGIDGLSFFFVILTTFLIPICILVGWSGMRSYGKEYITASLIREFLMIAVFRMLDPLLFYVLPESVLIPMLCGAEHLLFAGIKLFLCRGLVQMGLETKKDQGSISVFPLYFTWICFYAISYSVDSFPNRDRRFTNIINHRIMLSHGLVPSALFLCVGVLYDRHKTRLVRYYGGLVSTMPNLSTISFSSTLANMSSPGTSSFIGEFPISVGAFQRNSLVATLAALGMILGAAYSLWLYNRVVSGNLKPDFLNKFSDPNGREVSIFIPFLVGGATVRMGVHPKVFPDRMHTYVSNLVQHGKFN